MPDDARTLAAGLAIFAELMLGDAALADAATARALSAAQGAAGVSALRAWRALLEIPGLKAGKLPAVGQALLPLQKLRPGMRLLLLLAALSGRNSIEIAALLKISPTACEQALQRARQSLTAGELRTCHTALEMRQRGFSSARWAQIQRQLAADTTAPLRPEAKAASPRWGLLLAVAFATGLALAATWLWPPTDGTEEVISETPSIQTRPLAESPPALRDADTARRLADRALLTIPAEDASIAAETAFFAWYQAERLGQAGGLPPDVPEEAPIELPPVPVDWAADAAALPEPTDE
ncbi:hypothetical protein CO614_00760 [Lysobacteraceae bacterium NML120232]|nr:hypothetical protein CO614_00760 [Xanthomonadaceae bacterium NML120232]